MIAWRRDAKMTTLVDAEMMRLCNTVTSMYAHTLKFYKEAAKGK